ncbi:MAG: hypothetical protein ABUK01_00460 [Leptospirales bacterium]
MENSDRSYENLIKDFGEECLKNRFLFIYGKARHYIKSANIDNFAVVNEYLIDEILLDYFSDITRLKDFHGIERANPKKVAAYTAYWVSRRKPIQLIKDIDKDTLIKYPQIKWVNENFAISLMITMSYDTNSPIVGVDWGKFNKFEKNLRYYFTYRHLNSQMLELMLNAIDVTPIYGSLV